LGEACLKLFEGELGGQHGTSISKEHFSTNAKKDQISIQVGRKIQIKEGKGKEGKKEKRDF